MRRIDFSIAAGVVFGASFLTWAAVGGPSGIDVPFSGYLEDDGAPLNDSAVDIIFTLFDSSAGGVSCDSYTATVAVVEGRFSTVIDDVATTCVVGKDPHVEISVRLDQSGPATLLPGRQRLYPSIGAVSSTNSDFAVGGALTATGAVTAAGVTSSNGLTVSSGTTTISGAMNVAGTLTPNKVLLNQTNGSFYLQDKGLYLRNDGDQAHRLIRQDPNGTAFDGLLWDGVLLTGWTGGVLGTTSTGNHAALSWNSSRDVSVGGNLSFAASGNIYRGGLPLITTCTRTMTVTGTVPGWTEITFDNSAYCNGPVPFNATDGSYEYTGALSQLKVCGGWYELLVEPGIQNVHYPRIYFYAQQSCADDAPTQGTAVFFRSNDP